MCGTLTSFGFSLRSRETSMESWEMRESIWGREEGVEIQEGGGRRATRAWEEGEELQQGEGEGK